MLYAHTCAHTYKHGYTYVHMKLEEGKRPFLSPLQFDGEAEGAGIFLPGFSFLICKKKGILVLTLGLPLFKCRPVVISAS